MSTSVLTSYELVRMNVRLVEGGWLHTSASVELGGSVSTKSFPSNRDLQVLCFSSMVPVGQASPSTVEG